MKKSLPAHLGWAAALLICGAAQATSPSPVCVSPGAPERAASIADPCPTFSWGDVSDARLHQIVIYRLGGEQEEAQPVLEQMIPGSASSWTPPLGQCLETGRRYAWSMRAVDSTSGSDWSVPCLFQIAARPADLELAEALAVVRRYLATQERTESEVALDTELPSDAALLEDSESDSAAALAPSSTMLSVEGNVDADSFTGDGSGLVAVDADLLDGLEASHLAQKTEIDTEAELEELLTDVDDLLTSNDPVNADLLDGLDSTAFMPISADSWVNESGDTMSGHLDMGGSDIHHVRQVRAAGAAMDLTLSSDRDVIVSAPSGEIRLDASSSTIRLDAPAAVSGTLEAVEDDVTISGVTSVLTLTHTAGGSADDGIGTGVLLQVENDAGSVEPAAQIAAVLTDATASGEASELRFFTRSAGGSLTQAAALDGAGGLSVADMACTDCIGEPELEFDPATQTELDDHQALIAAHHPPTIDTTCDGLGCDGTNFENLNWDEVINLPEGFEDDLDNDTTYTAGPGLVLSGVQFSLGAYHAVPTDNSISTVDDTSLAGKYDSITIGADGLPVISYESSGSLLVAHCNDVACAGDDETISTLDGSSVARTSIAIGADGLPVIAYRFGGLLKVAHCNDIACEGGDETVSNLDGGGGAGHPSIAIGSDGLPVISYRTSIIPALKVAHCDNPACAGGSPTLSVVDSTADVGEYSSIAIGADGMPIIAYYDKDNTSLKVAHCNDIACTGGDETLSTVDNSGSVGQFASLTVGIDGLPIISYRGAQLKVAHCNDVACAGANETISIVDSDGNSGFDTSITIGADGLPVISYRNSHSGAVLLAHCDDIACSGGNEILTSVWASGTTAEMTAITIGADGLPVISFRQQGLKVARCASAFCVPYFRRR